MAIYSSFLLVRHETHSDLYIRGLPVGIIKEGHFVRHGTVDSVTGLRKEVILGDEDKEFLCFVAWAAEQAGEIVFN